MKVLDTSRLILRTFKDADLEPMTDINQDPKAMKYFPALQDKEQTRQLINRIQTHYDTYGYSLYAVELKQTQQMIGFVGLLRADFDAHFTPTVEIGWRLASNHWNKGYAAEAAKAVLNYAFTKLDLDELVSFTSENNKRSCHLMEKIGMHHDSQDDFDHPKLEKTNPLCRHVLYRLTKAEYINQHKNCSGNPS